MGLIDRRIGILFIAFVALLAIALARAAWLGSVQAASLKRDAATQQVSNVVVPAPRGTITDRNGAELAISESADDIVADPYLIKDAVSDAAELSPALGISQLTLIKLLTKQHTGFVYLAHLIPAAQALTVSDMNIAGISLVPETRRVYPRGDEASQVVGSVYLDGDGSSGIEYQYNNVLQGTNGLRRVVSDAIGQPISVDDLHAAVPGKTVALTIDSGLQQEVERVLAEVGSEYSPKSATAIAINPSTGSILALANWEAPGESADIPADQAVGFSYEPGSTFKAITVAGALQDGLVTPNTQFDIPPDLSFAANEPPIHDAEDHGYEMLSVAGILKVSSNIGADLIGQRLGAQRFNYWVHRFGFGSPTGIDLPGEAGGIILSPSQYSGASMYNLPFGQGESVTPIQMVTAYDAIANGGILRTPHVVQSVGGKAVPLPAGHRVISANTALELRDMLRGVFADGGTASGAEIPGYDMAGKTGTANIAIDGHYSDSAYVASFIGMVPTDHPRLVVAVVVNQPQGSIYGGSVAAPAFQQIVGWAVPYLGIPPR
ncbi:MAG TPA: penicillin-binding protein 2 [Solirubrobacteraceae bacterium]|nr:penicillin-binding protein 2 [Solirubrobacteraceae bacterium]